MELACTSLSRHKTALIPSYKRISFVTKRAYRRVPSYLPRPFHLSHMHRVNFPNRGCASVNDPGNPSQESGPAKSPVHSSGLITSTPPISMREGTQLACSAFRPTRASCLAQPAIGWSGPWMGNWIQMQVGMQAALGAVVWPGGGARGSCACWMGLGSRWVWHH